jgi:hypothetical protein
MAQAKSTKKILTGNRLRDGETVYYTGAGEWSPFVAQAKIAETQEEADSLTKIGAAAYAANQIIDVAVVDVDEGAGVRPTHIREKIRAQGPTVRADLNKPLSPPQR